MRASRQHHFSAFHHCLRAMRQRSDRHAGQRHHPGGGGCGGGGPYTQYRILVLSVSGMPTRPQIRGQHWASLSSAARAADLAGSSTRQESRSCTGTRSHVHKRWSCPRNVDGLGGTLHPRLSSRVCRRYVVKEEALGSGTQGLRSSSSCKEERFSVPPLPFLRCWRCSSGQFRSCLVTHPSKGPVHKASKVSRTSTWYVTRSAQRSYTIVTQTPLRAGTGQRRQRSRRRRGTSSSRSPCRRSSGRLGTSSDGTC